MAIVQKLRGGFVNAVLALGFMVSALTSQAAAQSAGVTESARQLLPAKMRDEGVLRIATALQWAPFAYRSDKGDAVGIDISIMEAVSAKLGLRVMLDDLKFPAIIPGVASGRYHVGVNQLSISPERLKVVDMIPYLNVTNVLLIPAGKTAPDLANLCGLTFVVTQGSVGVDLLTHLSNACVAKNAQPIVQQLYPSSAESLLAISNGRGDAFLTTGPQGVYVSRVNSKIQLVKGDVPNIENQPAGIAVEKGNAAMRKAIALALMSAIEDGSYKKILEEFGVATSAVPIERVQKAAE